MTLLAVPTVAQLADYSGRPEGSYTTFASSALLQATLMFQTVTELQPEEVATLSPEDSALATNGILAMADWVYLRQPYQAAIAGPFLSEHIGSYSYSKAGQEAARNAAALEVQGERTGVVFYDLAVQMLAKRTRAGGVFSGGVTLFEEGSEAPQDARLMVRDSDGRLVVLGPAERQAIDVPFDINAPVFPQDPGI